jgi:undecaprenyl diphosphate synthase
MAGDDGEPDRSAFAACIGTVCHMGEPTADVDLLVRTGGELRASDFLLWECAYAELHFVRTPWPDFAAADLDAALREFRRRDRRFGALPARAG